MANKLELTWVGKEKKIVVEPRILIADPEKSHHAQGNLFDQAADDNMLIHGDNLLALKSLEVRFAGQVPGRSNAFISIRHTTRDMHLNIMTIIWSTVNG